VPLELQLDGAFSGCPMTQDAPVSRSSLPLVLELQTSSTIFSTDADI